MQWLARRIDVGLTESGGIGPEGADIRMRAIHSRYSDETYNREEK